MAQNRTRWIPDTYIIIFFVVLFAALLTWAVPVGKFETHEIKYTMGSTEKSRNVLVPESFRYELDMRASLSLKASDFLNLTARRAYLITPLRASYPATSGARR